MNKTVVSLHEVAPPGSDAFEQIQAIHLAGQVDSAGQPIVPLADVVEARFGLPTTNEAHNRTEELATRMLLSSGLSRRILGSVIELHARLHRPHIERDELSRIEALKRQPVGHSQLQITTTARRASRHTALSRK